VLGSTVGPAPAAHAAGGFTAVYGAGNPLHVLGNHDVSTYVMIDADGDGDLDVAARERSSDAALDYFRNDGGSFAAVTGGANPFAGITFAANPANFVNTRVLTGDFDRDGDVDLWHHGVGFAAFYRNDGATFSAHTGAADPLAALAARDPGTYVVADVDGDSDPDVVVRDATTDASIDLLRNDGGSFVATSAPFASITFAPSASNFVNTCVLVLDADGDGDLDLWHQGVGFAALYRNDGATFSAHTGAADPLAALGAYDTHSYVTMDVDSDGDLDVVAREPVSDTALDVMRNDGGTFTPLTGGASPFAAVALATTDLTRTRALVGDHDGDGDADLYNQALNELYRQAGSAPVSTARAPAGGTTAAVTADLVLTFGEAVDLGAGAVTLRNGATGAVLARLDAGTDAAHFSGSGTTTITIDLPAPLPFATTVAVTVDPGTFVASVDGDAFAGLAPTAWRFATAANTAPGITGLDGDTTTFVEGDAPVALDAATPAAATDADGIGFDGGELTATVTAGAVLGEDHLSIGLFDGGTTVSVPLGPADDSTAVTALLRALRYTNDAGDVPTSGTRSVTVTLRDGGGLTAAATVEVTVQAVDDPPALDAPPQLTAAAGETVPAGAVTLSDPDSSVLDLHAEVDPGTLGDGTSFDRIGSAAQLNAALTALTWTAPDHASTGTLTLTVDDGTTAVSTHIDLRATAPEHTPTPPPSPPPAREPWIPRLEITEQGAGPGPRHSPRPAAITEVTVAAPSPRPTIPPPVAPAPPPVAAARVDPTPPRHDPDPRTPWLALTATALAALTITVALRARTRARHHRSSRTGE
jgi:hypothetical protein